MTKEKLRELDAWIAEHGFSIEVDFDESGEPYNKKFVLGFLNPIPISYVLHYSERPGHFSRIKREIKRRGWGWKSCYFPDEDKYSFEIFNKEGESWGCRWGDGLTEELAGCLAFKSALESEGAANFTYSGKIEKDES